MPLTITAASRYTACDIRTSRGPLRAPGAG